MLEFLEENEKQEIIEFLEIFRVLSHDERIEIKGYMNCLKNVREMEVSTWKLQEKKLHR